MSSIPVWITPTGAIGTYPSQIAMSVQFIATPIAPATSLTYAKLSGSLPEGLTISTTGELSGIPAITASETLYEFVVRITDDLGMIADRAFNITITGIASPVFTTPTGPVLTTWDSRWVELAIEYSNPVITNEVLIRVVQGGLPPGLEINSNGLIRGYAEPPIINVNYSLRVTTASAAVTNKIIVLSTFGFEIGRPVRFSGAVFGNVLLNVTYFVKEVVDATSFTISQTKGGDIFALNDVIGNMTVTLPQIQVGQPITQTYSFTLELTSDLGDRRESYSIIVINQNAAVPAGPGLGENSRTPTIYNTRPATFDVGKNDPTNYGYYAFLNGNINETYLPTQVAYIGKITSGEYFSFKMLGHDFDGDPLTYKYANLPDGLVGDPVTGWITGTPIIANNSISNFSFSMNVEKTSFPSIYSTTFNFGVTIVNDIIGDITWVTPSVLGSINNRDKSVIGVSALSDVPLSYSVESGKLPPNLKLDNTGALIGTVAYEPIDAILKKDTETTFNFAIRAYSELFPVVTSTKEFSLVVKQLFQQPTDTLYIKCVPSITDRDIIESLLTNTAIIPPDDVYRATDPNFGKASSVIYQHAYSIYASDFEEYVAAITKNHYWRNITLGELKTAVARNDAGEIVYEVVYSEVQDYFEVDDIYRVSAYGESVSEEVVWPRNIPLNLGPWYTSETDIYTSYIDEDSEGQPTYYTSLTPEYAKLLYPNSLHNMRTRTGQNLGQVYDYRLLPRWMTAQQTNGSTLGYTAAWVISYCKPGTAEKIKTNIETLWTDSLGQPYTLNTINFQLDRFTVDKSVTYNYNNNVSPPAWTGLPSATPPPDPIDSKDFHVLFPRRTILPDEGTAF